MLATRNFQYLSLHQFDMFLQNFNKIGREFLRKLPICDVMSCNFWTRNCKLLTAAVPRVLNQSSIVMRQMKENNRLYKTAIPVFLNIDVEKKINFLNIFWHFKNIQKTGIYVLDLCLVYSHAKFKVSNWF